MTEPDHLKCPCQQCGGSIEFPADGLGRLAACPHCGGETTLSNPAIVEATDGTDTAAGAPPPANFAASMFEAEEGTGGSKPSGARRRLLWIGLAVAALAGTAAWFVFKDSLARPPSSVANGHHPATNLEAPDVAVSAPASAPARSRAPKSIADLKAGPITLERSKGSSLVYAVGVLSNDSGHQRFGVNLELELTDARGNKAGTAKDYRAVLEPRQEWRFRALVLDPKAVSAKLAAIREEE